MRPTSTIKRAILVVLAGVFVAAAPTAVPALTIDWLERSVTVPSDFRTSDSLGYFGEIVQYIEPLYGFESVYADQYTNISSTNGVLTVAGSGAVGGSIYGYAGYDTTSTLNLTFTPLTDAAYSIYSGFPGFPGITFEPLVSQGETGTLVANTSYTLSILTDLSDDWNMWNIDFTVTEQTPVPLPPALWLFGPGLLGLAAMRRRFKK